MMYSWNPVFNKVIEIKNKLIDKIGIIDYNSFYNKVNEKTCLENWIEQLGIQEYIDLFKYVQINQNGTMLLIRYGKYSDVFGGEEEITSDIFWNMYEGFYTECRSIVIDVKDEFIVLSPFKKFKNLHEGMENQLDIIEMKIKNSKNVEITNKLDGSMQVARFVPEYQSIIMSGSQSISLEQSWRLQDGYNKLFADVNYINMLKENSEYTFIFEYITLKDAHVVIYTKEQEGLYLIGMRNSYTGEQLSYAEVKKYADKYNVKMTEIFDKTFDDVLKDVETMKSNEAEGFVINIDGHLIKVKSNDYVQFHRILSKISSINLIIQSIANNTFDDLLAKVPEAYRDKVNVVAKVVFNYLKETDAIVKTYYENAPKDNRKEFMIWTEKNVPKLYKNYVRNIYLGNENNYIKSGNEKSPSYKNMKEISGIENYNSIFEIGE